MSFNRIKYKDWTFDVDFDSTKELYSNVSQGSSEDCGCETCLNFAMQRNNLYPLEIKELFAVMGIDSEKELEITEWYELDNGLHVYSGWFHLFGKFDGIDCMKPTEGEGYNCEFTQITDHFHIGFTKRVITSHERKSELIQIEFQCEIPWQIKPSVEQIAKHNLQLLLLAPNNCLKKSEFKNIDGSELENSEEVIDLLLTKDLIETELEPESYFLSQYGYEFAENGTWPKELEKLKFDNSSFEKEADQKPATKRQFLLQKIIENSAIPFIITISTLLAIVIMYEESKQPRINPNVNKGEGRVLKGEELKQFIDSIQQKN